MGTMGAALIAFVACFILVPILLGIIRMFGVYVIVPERRCYVYVLFGKVAAILQEPGFHSLWSKMGVKALFINWIGKRFEIDLRLDQEYLRSQPVNSEEGAPMGIGIWYEMYISDPVAYLFKNTDPKGSLSANVSNSTVRCLSNMPLADMLSSRHTMSLTVRNEVSPQSHDWGYRLGSIYIRKVHFRDTDMIRQIESKVVNRLRQVNIITSTAERQAAVEFGKAGAVRPQVVGTALDQVSRDPDVAEALFAILETKSLLEGGANLTLIPANPGILADLVASQDARGPKGPNAPRQA